MAESLRDKFEFILVGRGYDEHAYDEEIFGELLDELTMTAEEWWANE
jgi:hypothetical protein